MRFYNCYFQHLVVGGGEAYLSIVYVPKEKKMKRALFMVVMLNVILSPVWSGGNKKSGGTNETYVFKYGHTQNEEHSRSKSMDFFKEELEKKSGGRIMVENYYSAVLGSEREMMDLVATGALQGTRGGLYADANPTYNIFLLPFIVSDWDEALRLVNSDFTARVNKGAAVKGFHIPACGISQGFRAHTNNQRPIRTPEDLKGLKMRVPPSEVYVETAKAFEENPQEINYSELYMALKTGVVDGQDNPPANIWDAKMYEVQKYLTITNYSTGPDPFMVNLAWYQALPKDLQTIFDEASSEAIKYSDQLNREAEELLISQLAEQMEVNYVEGAELDMFRDLVTPVYQRFVDKGYFTWDDINTAQAIAKG